MVEYKTILADPPWPYDSPKAVVGNAGRGKQNIEKIVQVDVLGQYDCMTIEAIKALSVKDVVAPDAHLYLWTTNAFLVEAHEVARAWGFKPKTLLTWVKTKHGKNEEKIPSMKCGYWYRSATEHILFAVRGKLRLLGAAAPTAYLLPRLPHSVKPDFFYDLIEKESPGPYLELFARRLREGWDCWGNEVHCSPELAQLKVV